jgi:hypothetical protein
MIRELASVNQRYPFFAVRAKRFIRRDLNGFRLPWVHPDCGLLKASNDSTRAYRELQRVAVR